MTREEALIITNELMYGDYYNFTSPIDLVNKIYDDFEVRITELEAPKTCDGCKYKYYDNDFTGYTETCELPCLRLCKDYYEPKDK